MTSEAISPATTERYIVDEPGRGRVECWSLPTDENTLWMLLQDVFQDYWQDMRFGTMVPGAVFEIRAPNAPTRVSLLDGYVTVDFGAWHFHVCIGTYTGIDPVLAEQRRTGRAELYRLLDKQDAPKSWGLRLYTKAGDQQLTVFLPNPLSGRRRASSRHGGLQPPEGLGYLASRLPGLAARPAGPGRARLCMRRLILALGVACAASAAVATTPPQRIVSLNLCTDQILLQLVARERIAALGWLSQNPESAMLYREAQGLRTVRGNAEEVIALQPDLVLVGTQTTRHTTRLLREFGIPVLALPGAESFVQAREQIRTVANAVGETARGEAVIKAMAARERETRATHASTTAVVATPYWPGGRSAGAGTLYDDILGAAGFANGAARAGLKGYGALPLERLIAQTPDVLLTNDYKRKVPTLGNRLLQHPASRGLGATEVTLPSPLMICGGPWNLEASARLAQQGAPQ